MTRQFSARITNLSDKPMEGVHLDYVPTHGGDVVSATTDASGVLLIDLETDTPYATGIIGVCKIDGVEYQEITVIHLTVPPGDGVATMQESITESFTTQWPMLLQRLVACESLLPRVEALEMAML